MTSDPGKITRLLKAGPEGEPELWSLVYDELKDLARAVLLGRRKARGPQTTTLVHEAYLRLLGSDFDNLQDRRHFFAVAARAMRFVLVDDARKRLADKRGSGKANITLSDEMAAKVIDPLRRKAEELLAVHEALERLGEINPRHVKLVELRYFSGFTVNETAEVLGVSRPTVVRDWRAVRAWLHDALESTDRAEA